MQRGSVRKRGGSWTVYYFTQVGTERRQHTKGGFPTKLLAEAYLRDVLREVNDGVFIEPQKLTLGDYLTNRWLPIQEESLRVSTYSSYEAIVRLHIVPRLGRVVLTDLTADHLDHLYARLLKEGRLNGPVGGGLSVKSVRHVHTLLQKALRDAVRKRLVIRNVASDADAPKLRRTPEMEMKTWTASELRQFLDGVARHRLGTAFYLAGTTGMRRGEVLGLRWKDVDFETSQLAVRQTVLNVRYGVIIGTPKTPKSRRTIALDPRTLQMLTEHRKTQAVAKTELGGGYADQDLVFAQGDGSPVHPDFMSQTFERAVKRLGLPRIRLHDLRHTYASISLSAGVPGKVVSDRLGHSTVAFTLDVYTHALPSLGAEAAETVSNLIFGDS